jgi:predicted enzyme related to lactoylglutathione lyase
MVKDVDAAHAWLVGRGAKVALPPTDFGRLARIMFVTDPDGNYIEFAGPIKAPK